MTEEFWQLVDLQQELDRRGIASALDVTGDMPRLVVSGEIEYAFRSVRGGPCPLELDIFDESLPYTLEAAGPIASFIALAPVILRQREARQRTGEQPDQQHYRPRPLSWWERLTGRAQR